MTFDLAELPPREVYKILASLVVPRPIALVTSLSPSGHINTAPFSFFNMLGNTPPIVALGISPQANGNLKHTASNILHTQEFVVNIVNETIANAMNICAIDFPENENELFAAGLTSVPSDKIQVPRIAESPANMECHFMETHTIGQNQILYGQVISVHIREGLIDPVTHYVDHEKLQIVGRAGVPNWYINMRDQFEMPRITYEQWKKQSAAVK